MRTRIAIAAAVAGLSLAAPAATAASALAGGADPVPQCQPCTTASAAQQAPPGMPADAAANSPNPYVGLWY
jgi:hypothetical protein